VGIPRVNINFLKILLSLPIQRRYIEYLISLAISNLKCMLQLQDIYLEGKTNDMYGDHPTQGDVHPHLPFWQHLVLVKDLIQIALMSLDNLNYPIKGHVIHGLKSL